MNLKLLQTEKPAEATSDLIGDKNADRLPKKTKVYWWFKIKIIV